MPKNGNKEYRDISELYNWKENPRNINAKDFERLKRQITKLGQYKPLLITNKGEVIGGNMRLRAYKELGTKKVWVSVVTPKNEDEKIEYALSDNDRAGYYDGDLLANLMPQHKIEWGEYAVDLKEPIVLSDLLPEPTEEDEVPEVEEGDPISKYGEVYQLGRHRLMCGDATKTKDVEKLMDDKKADMVFTDPPYNVDYEGYTKEKLKIKNDKVDDSTFRTLLRDSFKSHNRASKTGASMYICHPSSQQIIFEEELGNAGYSVRNQIIWAKNTFAWGMGRYKYQHEPIFYAHKTDNSDAWYGNKSQSTLWEVNKPSVNKEHPTMKPIQLITKAIRNSSKQDDIILDLFGGSGSTLMACEQTNRICYMMELDCRYIDVIVKRWENLTKEKSGIVT